MLIYDKIICLALGTGCLWRALFWSKEYPLKGHWEDTEMYGKYWIKATMKSLALGIVGTLLVGSIFLPDTWLNRLVPGGEFIFAWLLIALPVGVVCFLGSAIYIGRWLRKCPISYDDYTIKADPEPEPTSDLIARLQRMGKLPHKN